MRIVALLLLVAVADAVLRRDDVADSNYVTDPSNYPATTGLYSDPQTVGCGATLVSVGADSSRHLALAGHCLCHAPKKPSGWPKLKFGGQSYTVAKTYMRTDHKYSCKKEGPDKYDVGLIELTEDVAGVKPIPVYKDTDEQGQRMVIIGYGVSGAAGQLSNNKCDGDEDGKFRHAENTITSAGNGVLQYVMKKPNEGALPLEGMAESGDSGSPLLLSKGNTTYIAGVNSGCLNKNCCNYGTTDEYHRLSDDYDWIQGVISGAAFNASVTEYDVNALPGFLMPVRKLHSA